MSKDLSKCLASMIFCVTLSFIFFHCNSNSAGSEVTNEKVIVYMPGGRNTAAQAHVEIVPVHHLPKEMNTEVYTKITNESGEYSIRGIPDGIYNIIAKKDSFASLLDSIYIKNSQGVPDDTLEATGSLTAWVRLQPNHNPQSAYVQLIGTNEYFTNVDTAGKFTISNMPAGNYQLRVEVSLPYNYTPAFVNIRIRSAKSDTIYTPIEPVFNGIPVVTGIKASYNSQTGIVTVQWDSTTYSDFNDYAIFKDNAESSELSTSPYLYVSKPFFNDTIKSVSSGTTMVLNYTYRVAIRNKSLYRGETFRYATVSVVSGNRNNLLFSSDTISFKSNYPCTLKITPNPALGEINRYYWAIGNDNFTETSRSDTIIVFNIPGDSIIYDFRCIGKVITSYNLEITDTLFLHSSMVWEKIGESPQTSTGYYSASFKGSLFLFTLQANSDETFWKLWRSSDGSTWSIVNDSLPFMIQKKPLVFKDQLWIFERSSNLSNPVMWYSDDGFIWNSDTIDEISNTKYSTDYEIWSVWNNRIVIVNYFPLCYLDNSCTSQFSNVWESENGLVWNSTNLNKSIFPDRTDDINSHFVACEIDGLLYIGGAWRSFGLLSPSWLAYSFRCWNNYDSEPVQLSFPAPVNQNSSFSDIYPEVITLKGNLLLTSQLDKECIWALSPNRTWIRCTDSYPAEKNTQRSNNHTLCVHDNQLFSISNSGCWTIRQ